VKNFLKNKSYDFALRIVNLYKYLKENHSEYVLSKQILRSGTSIGALVSEAEFGQSKLDFINKLNIALKEANETSYWLDLLKDSEFINQKMYESIKPEILELIKLLVSSVKTAKKNEI
jgi:four helix bundle protein